MTSNRSNLFPTYKGRRITEEEYLEHWGKWVIIDEIADDLDLAVEMGLLFYLLSSFWGTMDGAQ